MKIQSDKLAEVKIERFFAMTELGIEQPPKIQLEPFWMILIMTKKWQGVTQNYSFFQISIMLGLVGPIMITLECQKLIHMRLNHDKKMARRNPKLFIF